MSVTVEIDVPQPRADVYAFLDVMANHEQFTDHFLVDWRLSGPARGVGATASFKAKGGGPGSRLQITVIESTPDRIVEEGRGGPGGKRRTTGIYELEPTPDGGTRITFRSEVLEPANRLEGLAAPLTRAYLRRQNQRAMLRLGEVLAGR
jgi:hypothetical protein